MYLASLPGGWIADRLLGLRRVDLVIGGILISLGHLSIGFGVLRGMTTFFLGLVLIVIGTGLLKPNISAIVGDLYPEGGARRDAGFSIFYMGINLGAFLGPIVTRRARRESARLALGLRRGRRRHGARSDHLSHARATSTARDIGVEAERHRR